MSPSPRLLAPSQGFGEKPPFSFFLPKQEIRGKQRCGPRGHDFKCRLCALFARVLFFSASADLFKEPAVCVGLLLSGGGVTEGRRSLSSVQTQPEADFEGLEREKKRSRAASAPAPPRPRWGVSLWKRSGGFETSSAVCGGERGNFSARLGRLKVLRHGSVHEAAVRRVDWSSSSSSSPGGHEPEEEALLQAGLELQHSE